MRSSSTRSAGLSETVVASAFRDNRPHGHVMPQLLKTDTLAGLAIRYNVAVSSKPMQPAPYVGMLDVALPLQVTDIKRINGILTDNAMFAREYIKIPTGQVPMRSVVCSSRGAGQPPVQQQGALFRASRAHCAAAGAPTLHGATITYQARLHPGAVCPYCSATPPPPAAPCHTQLTHIACCHLLPPAARRPRCCWHASCRGTAVMPP